MAKYRPISPQHAWRSNRSSNLDMVERYGELYLLSSPFANVIGCYKIVERIAAAEIGLNVEQLLAIFHRLEACGIALYENGHILVRTWFLHNTWESAFAGNVAKAALREIANLPAELRAKWELACIDAGVPQEIISGFVAESLQSPLEVPRKALSNKNHNIEQKTEQKTTTTTPKSSNVEQHRGGSYLTELHLLPIAENHRAFIESSVQGLSPEDAQRIADEVVGALEAARSGKREPIRGLHGWLPELVDRLRRGSFVPQWGPEIADKRNSAMQAQQRNEDATRERKAELERQEQERSIAEALLQEISSADLVEFAALAEPHVPLRDLRPKVKEAILRREMPPGLGCAAVLVAAKQWRAKVGAEQ